MKPLLSCFGWWVALSNGVCLGDQTILKKEREYRSALSADGDYGEATVTLEDPTGFGLGRGIYVASRTQRNFHGVCVTILNGKDPYLTLTRPSNQWL